MMASACTKNDSIISPVSHIESLKAAQSAFLENFETGTKTAYAAGNVTLTTGSWNFNDALIGNSSSDHKNGSKAARIRNSGIISMNFNKTTGAGTITIKHAKYGSDASSSWQLWYSTNNGSTYTQNGSTVTTSSTTLQTATFTLNVSGNVRIQVRKTDGSSNRINIDDISITDFSGTNPIPTLTTLSPNSATAGGNTFTLTLTGINFISTSSAQWNGTALTTTFASATKLTASVPASDIATAGTASVTVVNPAPGGGTSNALTFTINGTTGGGTKFLFDASHAETAGNADWVIDEDNNVQKQFPTPAQSTITSSTPETFWTGAISSWGIALVKLGDDVETLPTRTAITYGNSSNPQDLSNYNVFVVDEPNTVFTSAEKTAILQFVQNGGGLLMISDHTGSDRNNDGWDSPAIWNDLMTNNSIQNDPFGYSVDLTNISETTTNVLNSPTNPIMNGSQGLVTKIQYNNGATLTLHPADNANVQGLIWQTSATSQGNTNVMSASSTFGSGRVFVITDSSPEDDGTGASGNNLFVGWTVDSHAPLILNASLWLAKLQ